MEKQFLSKEALRSGFTGAVPATDDRELLAHLPDFVKAIATFPESMGAPYAGRLLDEKKLIAALHQPPSLTASYFPGHETLAANPPTLPATPGSVVQEESVGMLGLRVWLGEEHAALAGGWAGDRYRLYAIDDNTVNLVWDVRLATAAQADSFQQAAGGIVTALTRTPAAAGRKLHVERPATDTVRLVNEVE